MSTGPASLARFTDKQTGRLIPGLPSPAACPFCGNAAHVPIDWCGAGFVAIARTAARPGRPAPCQSTPERLGTGAVARGACHGSYRACRSPTTTSGARQCTASVVGCDCWYT